MNDNRENRGVNLYDKRVVTSLQMKEIERKAAEAGLSYYCMMENAGCGAAEYILKKHNVKGMQVLVFCGKGNNGGDGFVAARVLHERGAEVTLILPEGEPKTEDAIKNYEMCMDRKIPVRGFSGVDYPAYILEADILVDAIYGTGFHGELRETVKAAARLINHSKAVKYALDIPSGLNGDDCTADEDAVKADTTLVFHRLKPAHIDPDSLNYCGTVVCIPIGIEAVHREE
jgi:hydroxyethylthiazole kinase-like uncharacterized protein yjeF